MNARNWFASSLMIGVAAAGLFAVGCGNEEKPASSSSPATVASTPGGEKKEDVKKDEAKKDDKKDEAKKDEAKKDEAKKDDKGAVAADLSGLAKWKGKENPVKAGEDAVKKGKEIFGKNCASCHGDTGKGDGPAGEALDPKPRNFTTGEFKYGSEDWALMRTIMEGAPGAGNGMAGWDGRMDEKDAWTVIHYIKSLKK